MPGEIKVLIAVEDYKANSVTSFVGNPQTSQEKKNNPTTHRQSNEQTFL